MALSDIFKNPDQLRELSTFLLNFGQNTLLANQRGMGPLAALGLGFSAGGQALEVSRRQKLQDEIIRAKLDEERRKQAANASLAGLLGANFAATGERVSITNPNRVANFSQLPPDTQRQQLLQNAKTLEDLQAAKAAESLLPDTVKPTERDKKIFDLRLRGFSLNDAQDIADGRVRLRTDPSTGQSFLANVATGQERPTRLAGSGSSGGEPSRVTLTKEQFKDLSDQQIQIDNLAPQIGSLEKDLDAVGFVPVLKELSSKTLGQIPGEIGEALTFRDVVKQRQRIRLLREDMIKALAKNPRVPVNEQKRIIELLPETGVFESPEAAKAGLEEVARFLEDLKDRNNKLLGRSESTPSGTSTNPARPQNQQDFDALPSGSFFIDPESNELRKKN